MPAEVLSYFLKHGDVRLKLRFQIVLKCAPFLKGLKVSCGITLDSEVYYQLHPIFKDTEIIYRKLLDVNGRCLVLFYRKEELREYMNRIGNRSFLRQYGYEDMELEAMLMRLANRVCMFAENGMNFPHEIGIFLGYPMKDVKGFIEHAGRGALLTGYWKVYSNPWEANRIFAKYEQAKMRAVNEFLAGRSIKEIAQK